jgi:hypothetical protein
MEVVLAAVLAAIGRYLLSSDHLDSPTVIADPRADIGDITPWTSQWPTVEPNMTIVGHTFQISSYVFQSIAERTGKTTATTSIVCRFARRACGLPGGDADFLA